VKARRVKKLDPAEPLADNAARIIRVRLDELRSLAPRALEPGATRRQHDMRIAAKRLRYVLETTEFCFGRVAETARRRARDLQEVLGDLHDCDLMLPRVEGHLDGLREADATAVRMWAGDAGGLGPELAAHAPHRTSYRGLEILIVYLRARRRLLFEQFSVLWAEQENAGVWDRLDRAMTNRLEVARERRRAAKRAEQARERLAAAEREEREAAGRASNAAADLQTARREARGPVSPHRNGG
jgi:CHAD domain-containing protein